MTDHQINDHIVRNLNLKVETFIEKTFFYFKQLPNLLFNYQNFNFAVLKQQVDFLFKKCYSYSGTLLVVNVICPLSRPHSSDWLVDGIMDSNEVIAPIICRVELIQQRTIVHMVIKSKENVLFVDFAVLLHQMIIYIYLV